MGERYPKHIEYSHKYADDDYEYRHVILTQVIHESLPKDLKVRYERTLTDREWRELGVQQSLGWVHYMWHKPEPHILLFRRRLGTDPLTGAIDPQLKQEMKEVYEKEMAVYMRP